MGVTATSAAARRPIVVYLTAVVGPTLIVLTLGILAARRQYEATEALRSTARRLQEERIVEEATRALTVRASEALAEPAFAKIAVLTSSDDPMVVDTGRALIPELQRRHPVVREVFVVADDGVRYPRVAPSFPKALEDWLMDEPSPLRARLSDMIGQAQRAEVSGHFAIASGRYHAVYDTARTKKRFVCWRCRLTKPAAVRRRCRAARRRQDSGRRRGQHLKSFPPTALHPTAAIRRLSPIEPVTEDAIMQDRNNCRSL